MPEMDNAGVSLNEVPVKVAVRIRPLTNRERLHKHQPCVKIIPESNQIVIGKDKSFTFDYVLPPKTTQSELYAHCVDSLVRGLFEGYNATVFAYGQTGSGKTHTINGNLDESDEVGIIPRAVSTIFELMRDHEQTKQFTIKVSYLEIYKDDLKDLLDSTSDKEMHIRENEAGNVTIYGANEVSCTTLEEVMSCFENGSIMRHTGSTNMNEQSSRSHSIFSIFIEQRWSSNGSTVASIKQNTDLINDIDSNDNLSYLGAKFHFVDLAGSERVGRTGNVGDRFKESIHINSGLLALGNVISALSSSECKKKHIPYRDSKITRLLKDSLGGNAKTLMICCISPSSCNLDESINAVKYASRARFIRNKPIVNMDPQTQRFVEMQGEIKALREELHRQRTQLQLTSNQQVDDVEFKQMESRLLKAENETSHFKRLFKDACSIISDLSSKQEIDFTLRDTLRKWLDRVDYQREASANEPDDSNKQKIIQLESQLKQAYNDLKSDEEIFCDKEKEIADLKEKIKDLEVSLMTTNRYLEASYAKEKEQQELMVQLQIQIDKLIKGKSQAESRLDDLPKLSDSQVVKNMSSSTYSILNQNKSNKQRAKTAPNGLDTAVNKQRQIFSTPALFSLEKVMQGFRARTQLLTETLEENDNVLQKRIHESDLEELDKEQVFVRRGTFSKPKKSSELDDEFTNKLVKSSEQRINAIKESETKLKEAQQKMRDLNINIKMKEELIKELVANSKLANRINYEYQHRIENLQKECSQAKSDLQEVQHQIQQVNVKDQSEKSKLELEYKKKYELAQQKISELETRQKDTTKFLNITNVSEKRIQELELTLGKMRQQQESLQKKLKEDSEKKLKLEKDLEREQQRIKELNVRHEQQQKILKKKTEDLANAQRKLRTGSALGLNEDSQTKSQHWIEQEMEKIIQEKRQLDTLKVELEKREQLVAKREILQVEKNELQIKKLRSSISIEINLKENLQTLMQQRKKMDERLSDGNVLSSSDERRLIEIEEAIEAIETAIEFENDSIAKLKKSTQAQKSLDSSEGIIAKLSQIPHDEAKHLIRKFFNKIIDLKENERKRQMLDEELHVQLEEKTRLVEEFKKSIGLTTNELERRLIMQQKQYEKQINILMAQLNDCTDRVHEYEKEICVYKEKLGRFSYKSSSAFVETNHHTHSNGSIKVTSINSDDFNHAGESLKSSSASQQQLTSIKLPKKGLRPLSEDEIAKRTKKI